MNPISNDTNIHCWNSSASRQDQLERSIEKQASEVSSLSEEREKLMQEYKKLKLDKEEGAGETKLESELSKLQKTSTLLIF